MRLGIRLRHVRAGLVIGPAAVVVSTARGQDAPRIDNLVSSATYRQEFAQGSYATIFGDVPIAEDSCIASTVPLPTDVCGVSVIVNGEEAPIYFANKQQINFLLPNQQGQADVMMAYDGMLSNPSTIIINDASPGIFQRGQHFAALVSLDGTIMEYYRPLESDLPVDDTNRIVQLYFTGGGTTGEVIGPGDAAPTDRLVHAPTPTVKLDGQQLSDSDILFAGRSPGFIGLWVADIRLPPLASGAHTIEYCVNDACDSADIIAAASGTPFLTGNISDMTNKDATFAGTLTGNDANIAQIRTTPLGTFLIESPPNFPATLKIDQSSGNYGVLTTTVTQGPIFKQMIPWIEDTTAKYDYNPYATVPDGILWQQAMFTPSQNPINSIEELDYQMLQGIRTPHLNRWSTYPVPIYFDATVPQDIKSSILTNCPTPWNKTGEPPMSVIVNSPPKDYGLIVHLAQGGAVNHFAFDTLPPSAADWTPTSSNYTKVIGDIYLTTSISASNSGIPTLPCTMFSHESGHALGFVNHDISNTSIMYGNAGATYLPKPSSFRHRHAQSAAVHLADHTNQRHQLD